jgi:hypothetical protein
MTHNCNLVTALYPNYYARVSASFPWIRSIVCAFSIASPMYFNCSILNSQVSGAPSFGYLSEKYSRLPTASLVPTISYVPILLKIKVDAYPDDVEWYIQEVDGEQRVVEKQHSEGYMSSYRTYFEEIKSLQPDTEYKLILFDFCPGGMNGFVTIFLAFNEGDSNILAFVDLYEVGSFERLDINFRTSLNSTGSLPSAAPSASPSIMPSQPSISPSPTYMSTVIMIRFRTYEDSRTTSWRLQSSFGTVLYEEPAGFFRGNEPIFLRSVEVNDGEAYTLIIADSKGYGFSGEASVYYGSVQDESTLLAYYNGYLGTSFFQKAIAFTAAMNSTIIIFPTMSPSTPTSSPAPTGPSVSVMVTVKTDMYPLDTGWKISTIDDSVVSQISIGTFKKRLSQYSKQVYLFSNKKYYLTIMDKFGDGMQGSVRVSMKSGNSSLILVNFNQSDETFSQKEISFEISVETISSIKPSTSMPHSISVYPSPQPTERFSNISGVSGTEVPSSLESLAGTMASQVPTSNMAQSSVEVMLISYTFFIPTLIVFFPF